MTICSFGPRKKKSLGKALLSALLLAVLVCAGRTSLHAQATLLLEEPYSYDGAFAGTGHAAVYLARVCAASPVKLRRCAPGERGAVISRYHGIAGYDWMAVPLIPYLYAVDRPENVPLYADPKLVAFLREQYLARVKDDLPEEAVLKTPSGPWYELAGSAYDRTLYGFEIKTTPEQDDALIRRFNSSPNREAYNLLKRNCADFVRQVINFYYPKAVHRSIIEDLGVTTPKQTAKTLVGSSRRHAAMQLTTFIIPQVPGMKRSRPLHGVLDSVLLAKKYMMPLALLHPFMAGGAEVAYLAAWRFHPAADALVFDPARGLGPPLLAAQRRADEERLRSLTREAAEDDPSLRESAKEWPRLQASAEPAFDHAGAPVLQIRDGDRTVQVGLCRANLLRTGAPPELVQKLMLARLQQHLERSRTTRASESEVADDWNLLEKALALKASPPQRQIVAEEIQPRHKFPTDHLWRH